MEEITVVIRFEGRPPAISANTEALGGKITEVYFGNALSLEQEAGGDIVRYKDSDCEIISVVKE